MVFAFCVDGAGGGQLSGTAMPKLARRRAPGLGGVGAAKVNVWPTAHEQTWVSSFFKTLYTVFYGYGEQLYGRAWATELVGWK